MYIKFNNFKCYSDKVFEFEETGIFLINGRTGHGKSTILEGINYALYGIGKDIIKWGEKSCSVELHISGLKIYRCNRPGRLVVNDKFEDDVAQSIINEKFGTKFNCTGYIEQKAANSFVTMSPSDKLTFLEQICFHDINMADIKNRCRSQIVRTREELTRFQGQLEFASKQIEDMEEPEEVEFPLKVKNKELAIKNEETKYKNCDIKIKKTKKAIDKLNTELSDIQHLNTFLKIKDEYIDNLVDSIENLKLEETEYIGDEELDELKSRLKSLKNSREITLLKENIKTAEEKLSIMKQTEIEEIEKEISNLSSELWTEYSKEEAEETISDTKLIIKDVQKISNLKKQLVEVDTEKYQDAVTNVEILRDELEHKQNFLKIKNKSYSCPCCKNKLYMDNDTLKQINEEYDENIDINEIKKEIQTLRNSIKQYEENIIITKNNIQRNLKTQKEIKEIVDLYESEDDLNEEELKETLDQIKQYFESQLKTEKKITELERKIKNNMFSSSIVLFEKDLEKQKKTLGILESETEEYEDEYMTEEELQQTIIEEEKRKSVYEKIQKQKSNFIKEQEKNKLSIEKEKAKHIEKYNEIRSIEVVEEQISENLEFIKQQEEQKEIHKETLSKIEEYKKYTEELSKYNSYVEKITELEEKVEDCTEKHNASLLLNEKILEARMITTVNIVETINMYAQQYLDCFFTEDPISVTLKCFKEKSDKPQINMDLFYKDNECNIKSISGGEFDRVVLAFTLALSEIFNSPMLLLDECTAGLDEETTAIVFETIRESMKNKPVFVIGHQIVQGVFDQIIDI